MPVDNVIAVPIEKMVVNSVANLSGAALNWAVAKAAGLEIDLFRKRDGSVVPRVCPSMFWVDFEPSTNWEHAGPLLDKFDVWLRSNAQGKHVAVVPQSPIDNNYGDTKLIAACRCIVTHILGETVEVPAALLGGGS